MADPLLYCNGHNKDKG